MSSIVAYEITTPIIALKITLNEVDKLYIHEEILEKRKSWLVNKIRADNFFKDPIIVDEKTMVVLDGMHRVAASRELGFKYIPVCLVDYDNPRIELYSWSRLVSVKDELRGTYKNIEEARSAALYTISRLGFRLVNIANYNAGKAMLSRRELIALIYTGRTLLGIRYPTSGIKSMYEQIKKAEKALEMRGFEISYQTEKDSMLMLEGGANIMAIVPPPISKSEVRSLALSGEVFVHKSTRHVIPARPLNVNIPLDWLSGKYTIDEARRMLLEHLVKKSIKRLPPGTVLDRRYDEELYVFQ